MPSGNLSEVEGSKPHPPHPTHLSPCWQRRANRLGINSAVKACLPWHQGGLPPPSAASAITEWLLQSPATRGKVNHSGWHRGFVWCGRASLHVHYINTSAWFHSSGMEIHCRKCTLSVLTALFTPGLLRRTHTHTLLWSILQLEDSWSRHIHDLPGWKNEDWKDFVNIV